MEYPGVERSIQYVNSNYCALNMIIGTCREKTVSEALGVVDGRGLMLWLFVGPTGVYLLDFFCSGIQFNLLLSPYPCFISLLYLDLYVLGDDALIS